ncbi:MAG: hypothetical protein LBQ18_03485 [Campylobacteraceae bacterium]|nr:hypothetical protein [Campylobacteraceae bacterium]
MKKIFLLVFMLQAAWSEIFYDENGSTGGGFYLESALTFSDNKDKKIGETQSAQELTGKRKSIKELDLGLYMRDDRMAIKMYGSLWFGNADQYGVGFGAEGKYRLFPSIPIALVLGFDDKIGIGDDVFEERNVSLSAINNGAPTVIYLTDDTRFNSFSLKLGLEWDISKHFALNLVYVPSWDNYKVRYNQRGNSFKEESEIKWHELHNLVKVGFAVYF